MKPFIRVNRIMFLITAIIYLLFAVFLVVYYNLEATSMSFPLFISFLVLGLFALFASAFAVVNTRYYKAYKIIKGIADYTHDGILITNHENAIIYANERAIIESGYALHELIGATPSLFNSGKHSKSFYLTMWDKLKHDGFFKGEIWDVRKDGTLHPKNIHIFTVTNRKKKILNYVAVYQDLSQIKQVQAQSKQNKYYNPYTDLPNQMYTLNRMRQLIDENKPFSLLLIKVTNKRVIAANEGLMYYFDSVRHHSNRVVESFKPNLIGEVESDVFAVIIEKKEKIEKQIIDNLIDAFEGVSVDAAQFECQAGLVQFPKDGSSASLLLTKASIALGMNTEEAHNRFTYFDAHYHDRLTREYYLKDMIVKGLEENEFYMVYQPILSVKTHKIQGVEALVRWQSKTLGYVMPSEFIPVAEKYRLMDKLGRFILYQTLQDKAYFDVYSKHDLSVSMNTSATQYVSSQLLHDTEAFLTRFSVKPEGIIFEITESTLIKNISKTQAYLKDLNALGIKIAIDDYGTGFSSLQYLNLLPIDLLKIDRSFIKDYPKHDKGTLAASVINLGKELSMRTIAEGVETKEQFDFLVSKGVTYIQGYYVSKPLTREQVIERVNKQ